MNNGTRVEVRVAQINGDPQYMQGVVISMERYQGLPRYTVRCDSGTVIHFCCAESLRVMEEAA